MQFLHLFHVFALIGGTFRWLNNRRRNSFDFEVHGQGFLSKQYVWNIVAGMIFMFLFFLLVKFIIA